MIREAKPDEADIVVERLIAEVVNSGRSAPMIAAGGIMRDIEEGKPWFIDDDDERVVIHAHREWSPVHRQEVAFVTQVWGPSLRHEEMVRWLANHLLAKWGDLIGVYPEADDSPIAQKATAALRPTKDTARTRSIRLSDGARILNEREEKRQNGRN